MITAPYPYSTQQSPVLVMQYRCPVVGANSGQGYGRYGGGARKPQEAHGVVGGRISEEFTTRRVQSVRRRTMYIRIRVAARESSCFRMFSLMDRTPLSSPFGSTSTTSRSM